LILNRDRKDLPFNLLVKSGCTLASGRSIPQRGLPVNKAPLDPINPAAVGLRLSSSDFR